jgi:hypothetical protein
MEKRVKAKGAYSTPHILEKHVVRHVTEGNEEEVSKGQCRQVGGGVGACVWGTSGWRKKRTCPSLYIA